MTQYTAHAHIDPAEDYAVFYIANLRTRESQQVAIVTGTQALAMIGRSDDTRRLAFAAIGRAAR